MELTVYKINGETTDRKVVLKDEIFAIEPNDHAIYLDVKQIMANKRQGTHKSKERGEIAGSTRKIKRQKGTGTARAGSIKSPVFRGGGRVFGPQPRDYSFKLNKKVKRIARKSALTYKAEGQSIMVVEDFNFDSPKTKDFIGMLKAFQLDNKKVLLVTSETKSNVYLSARNIQKVKYLNANSINTYDILNANKIILVEGALEKIESMFSN
jgi:large subunit ribosomal protein L4